jgi:hypothetical protein
LLTRIAGVATACATCNFFISAGFVDLKRAGKLRSGATLFTAAEPLKRVPVDVLQQLGEEAAAAKVFNAWFAICKDMACLSLALTRFQDSGMFWSASGDLLILPAGPLMVIERAYSDSEAESVVVGERLVIYAPCQLQHVQQKAQQQCVLRSCLQDCCSMHRTATALLSHARQVPCAAAQSPFEDQADVLLAYGCMYCLHEATHTNWSASLLSRFADAAGRFERLSESTRAEELKDMLQSKFPSIFGSVSETRSPLFMLKQSATAWTTICLRTSMQCTVGTPHTTQ